jgi:transcriptional regulator with XRE-family HTH domain
VVPGKINGMPTRYRRRDLGAQRADASLRQLAEELRSARLSAGLSLRSVAAATGISASQLSRLERAASPWVSVRMLSVLFAVLGMRLSVRPYPEGTPLRDAAHARLLARFRAALPSSVRLRTEVPLRRDGDLRAWDAEVEASNGTCKVEAETMLHDLQATERRIALKMADDGVERVILLVADTHRNRQVMREFRASLAVRFPLDTRAVLDALRAGRVPPHSGVVLR